MTRRKLKLCRKCQVSPTEERVELYGIMQIKISCPQCGLAVYAPPTAKINISDRWNLINSRNTPIGYLAEECLNGTPYEELY